MAAAGRPDPVSRNRRSDGQRLRGRGARWQQDHFCPARRRGRRSVRAAARQSEKAVSANMARRISLRLGMVGDLATLVDIDADAGTLFEESGLFLDLPDNHEFPVSERRGWQE